MQVAGHWVSIPGQEAAPEGVSQALPLKSGPFVQIGIHSLLREEVTVSIQTPLLLKHSEVIWGEVPASKAGIIVLPPMQTLQRYMISDYSEGTPP